MGRLVINNAMMINGAFEAPSPEEWLVLDPDSNQVSLEQFLVADAMLLGRRTYQGLAEVWPQLADHPTLGLFADRLNAMPKYVTSRTLRGPLEWNATLLEGELAESVPALKDKHQGTLIVSGAGELAHALTTRGLVDEFWSWVSPYLWPAGPRIFDGIGPLRLQLIGGDDVRLGGAAAGLPASTRPAGRRSRLGSGEAPQGGACSTITATASASINQQAPPLRAAESGNAYRRDRRWRCPRTPRTTTSRCSTPTPGPC
jgi:dihydrofolate reductase